MTTWISTRSEQFTYFDKQLGSPDWAGKRVLDFGGNVGNLLLDANCRIDAADYWSIDISRDAIPEGKRRHPRGHFILYDRYSFQYNPAGIVGLPIPDPGVRFDFIVAYSVFTHTSKAETLEIADQLAALLTEDGIAALTFLDPLWVPPPGWVIPSDPSPGRSNLDWRLAINHKLAPEMDVPALRARADATRQTWTTLANHDDLSFDPDDDGLSEDRRQGAYITFCTPDYMQQLFPAARILDPVVPERQHCLVADKAGLRRR